MSENSQQQNPFNPQQKTQLEQKNRLLIINPSPRKIKPFEQRIQWLNRFYDIFREKYNFDEKDAYNTCRDFFLSHTEYTHLAIIPDDLLVEPRHVQKLMSEIDKSDYKVLSGISNFACTSRRMFNNMTAIEYTNYGAVEQLRKTGRFDYFKQIMTRDRYQKLKEELKDKPNRIIQVAWSAFPITIAKRDVIEKIKFDANLMGVDTVFFQQCIKNQIPTFADLDVETVHLKGIEENRDMDYFIKLAWEYNIDTKVVFVESSRPVKEEIFLPKIQ